MNQYATFLDALETLQTQQRQLIEDGFVLFDAWIAASRPGGTARTKKAHYQLRSRKAQFEGKKSRYLKADEVEVYREAIARGKQIRALDKQVQRLQQRIEKIDGMMAKWS